MATKLLCYLIFALIEGLIILGSIVVVICVYLPFVALKGGLLAVLGRACVKPAPSPHSPPA